MKTGAKNAEICQHVITHAANTCQQVPTNDRWITSPVNIEQRGMAHANTCAWLALLRVAVSLHRVPVLAKLPSPGTSDAVPAEADARGLQIPCRGRHGRSAGGQLQLKSASDPVVTITKHFCIVHAKTLP